MDSPLFLIALAVAFGLAVGSFLNVVIYRLPLMMERDWRRQSAEILGQDMPDPRYGEQPFNLAVPRSRCPCCGHAIAPWQNVPVLSYLLLRGRCGHCESPISLRYPLIELTNGLLFGACVWHFGPTLAALGAMGLVAALLALALIDFDTQLLPDSINQPLLWAGIGLNLLGTYTNLPNAVIGAMAGYLFLWLIYWGFRLVTGKEGMGQGDFKLLAALGAWLGWQMLPAIVLLSSVVGALLGGLLILLAGRGRDVPMPFGPFLAAAGGITLFWGKPLTLWLLGAL